MAEYQSQYPELGFYVKGRHCKFSGGRYVTDDPAEIEVLNSIIDAVRVDEPKENESKSEEPVKATKKPVRKTSAK
ncbi:hypothetical protein WD019_02490 [Fictibacillus sp. Mic-4]|uniref:hypothetical protein n=1 Tax=Fictibacillus sp. Mic-4 TaxID=3132826 RepID=UPI003CEFD823